MKNLIKNPESELINEGLNSWEFISDQISKTFEFKTFKNAMEFMQACVDKCEDLNHHPNWSNVYNKVMVNLTTHDSSGVTELDFALAKSMDRIYVDFE